MRSLSLSLDHRQLAAARRFQEKPAASIGGKVAIKRRIEIKTLTKQVMRINRRNTVIKGWCAKCGQEVEITRIEKLVPRSQNKRPEGK